MAGNTGLCITAARLPEWVICSLTGAQFFGRARPECPDRRRTLQGTARRAGLVRREGRAHVTLADLSLRCVRAGCATTAYWAPFVVVGEDAVRREAIDWSPFFATWELTGKFPAILDDAKYGIGGSIRSRLTGWMRRCRSW
jgi:hypothetical protein